MYLQGEEVMNTYGQLSNTSLLHMYGFAELGNPHDKVCSGLAPCMTDGVDAQRFQIKS